MLVTHLVVITLTITVTGMVDKDDAGNVTVVATSLCRE